MKVFLATQGSYSDYAVRGVFANRADAKAYELGDDVEEFEIAEGPVDVRDWHMLRWFPGEPEGETPYTGAFTGMSFARTNPREDSPYRRDYDGRPNHIEHRWHSSRSNGVLIVEGWEIERIRKVFGELRAEWLTNQSLGMTWDATEMRWAP